LEAKMKNLQMLKIIDVVIKTTLSKSTIWKLVKEKKFPQPYKIANRRTAWRLIDIEAYINAKRPKQ